MCCSEAGPISLLTSSDEDGVIIEEPHIDTVEVSDETDEDDVPLTRLLPPPGTALMHFAHHTQHYRTCNRPHVTQHKVKVDGRCGVVVGTLAYYSRGRGFDSCTVQTFLCLNCLYWVWVYLCIICMYLQKKSI
jgi:hypothetical protein